MPFLTKTTLVAAVLFTMALSGCKHDPSDPGEVGPLPIDPPPIETPCTAIPDEFVGTWYASHNEGPLTANWENGTFQGEQGFREFRTMTFTQDGKNAVEYTTAVYNAGDETRQRFYKIMGTLEYKANPAAIVFHAQSGTMRVFSNKYTGYRESPIVQSDLQKYQTVWEKPQATNMTTTTNYLTATIIDQDGRYSVKYQKVTLTPTPTPSNLPSTTPPATGSFVKMGSLYYPTARVGNQEWMTANYAGPGSLKEASKPHYGTFLEYAELKNVPVPSGWRIPTRQDYEKLLQSQGLTVYAWGTDGDDLQSKKLLGQLMASTGWTKQDGYANNQSGFNAVPADVRRPRGTNYGEGTNCVLWTADKDSGDNPLVFNIIQMPSSTYANFSPQPIGYSPTLTPLRLVRNN